MAFPSARTNLFSRYADGYSKLIPELENIKETIVESLDFIAYKNNYNKIFESWKQENKATLLNIPLNTKPKNSLQT